MRRFITASIVAGAAAVAFVALSAAYTQPPAPAAKPPSGNVRDHGAKGDGTADDWQALQQTVNAGVGVVHLPPGTYRISKPVIVDLEKVGITTIRGEGAARILMAGEGPAFQFVGTHGGTAAPATVQENVWQHQRMPGVDGIEITGTHPKANGIEATGTMKLTITGVLIRRCGHGVHLTNRNRNVVISHCHIYENHGVGVFLDHVNLHQINVVGSHISYNGGGGVVCLGGQVRNLQISGCDIEANHGENRPPTANVLIDSTDGTNAEVAITGCTLQHTRKVAGSANVRIKGPTTPLKGADERRDGHVTIVGNVISDSQVNLHFDHARGVVVSGNTVWTGEEYNLLAEHSTNIVVGPNNFDRNPRYFREEDTATDALLFRDCTDCTLTGFQLLGTRKTPAGITLERCDRFNISGLTILDCDGGGLLLKDVSRSRVGGCLIRDDRPGEKTKPFQIAGGKDNQIEISLTPARP